MEELGGSHAAMLAREAESATAGGWEFAESATGERSGPAQHDEPQPVGDGDDRGGDAEIVAIDDLPGDDHPDLVGLEELPYSLPDQFVIIEEEHPDTHDAILPVWSVTTDPDARAIRLRRCARLLSPAPLVASEGRPARSFAGPI